MPRVTHVKKARKAIPRFNIEVGDSYYWWKFMVGGRGGPKVCSKTPPRPSQLTQSSFLQAIYGAQESLDAAEDPDGFRAVAQEIREAGEECQGSFDNMPEGLQQGDTGQLLEERVGQCEEWADEIETAADELETAISNRDELRAAWATYDAAVAEYDPADEDSEEPEEPEDDERPPEDDSDLVEEARESCGGPF